MTEPTEPASYKDTLNLPKTSFDMKANLITKEPAMLKAWQEADLYKQIRARPHPKGKWVLHDGPPYANGDIHIGHLVNKVLKDIVVKFRTMQGYDSPYVPGWDCHGLPIESAIQKDRDLAPKLREMSKEDFRNHCRDYAMKYVNLQAESFKRLGIFGDYDRPYLTMDPKYESGILEVLAELVQRDLVYRKKKPVHWCTNDRTALAEAELEYANRKDNSIYVLLKPAVNKLAIRDIDNNLFTFGAEAFPVPELMIWTTTPWTLPANRAVAVNPDEVYSLMIFKDQKGSEHYVIVASKLFTKIRDLQSPFAVKDGPGTYQSVLGVGGHFLGKELAVYSYLHPIDSTLVCPVVTADYVTMEDGTGLVHTAPGHGTEDYQTGLRNNLEVYNPVLPDGRYDDTVPEFLRGKTIWDANALVIEKLKELGTLFHHQEFDHSYPHCWRCKKPVIFRATEQWFVDVDKTYKLSVEPITLPPRSIRDRSRTTALAYRDAIPSTGKQAIAFAKDQAVHDQFERLLSVAASLTSAEEVSQRLQQDPEIAAKLTDIDFLRQRHADFIPSWGANRLNAMLENRPDWCISRQRSWGVPIPAFFDDKGNCLLTAKSVAKVAAYFKEHGATSWYTDPPEKILGATEWTDTAIAPDGQILSSFVFRLSSLSKGQDILDVWFESGASHHAVLECTHPELGYPANMYLEGSDQHRGWFQSSLLEAAGYKSEPPFKQLLTHGFVVDEKGMKYSKSSGNYVPLDQLLKQQGADVMRLWVASVDYQNDIKFSKELLNTIGEAYRKIRNTIRYLLGNLYDFNPTTDRVELNTNSIDAQMNSRAMAIFGGTLNAYDKYEFHIVFKNIYEFCNVDISAFYAKAIKDRLYCELPSNYKRRTSQTVCYDMLVQIVKLVAPVLVYTAEEAWAAIRQLPGGRDLPESVHLAIVEKPAFGASKQHTHWTGTLLPLIEKANKQLDDLKRTIGLGNPLDAEALIILPKVEDEVTKLIAEYGPEIEDALGCGFHRIEHGETWDIKIIDTREKYASCARSWKRRPDVGSDPEYPDLSARDAKVVRALRTQSQKA